MTTETAEILGLDAGYLSALDTYELKCFREFLIRDMDTERFCHGCEYITMTEEKEEFWGMPCYRNEPSCPTDFIPIEIGCPLKDDYEDLKDRLEFIEQEISVRTRARVRTVA